MRALCGSLFSGFVFVFVFPIFSFMCFSGCVRHRHRLEEAPLWLVRRAEIAAGGALRFYARCCCGCDEHMVVAACVAHVGRMTACTSTSDK